MNELNCGNIQTISECISQRNLAIIVQRKILGAIDMLLIKIIGNGLIKNRASSGQSELIHREKVEKRLNCRAGLSFA